MNTPAQELSLHCIEAEATLSAERYRQVSSSLNFGIGDVPILERLLQTASDDSFEGDVSPENVIAGGWAALEVAAHMPTGRLRTKYENLAHSRFQRVSALESTDQLRGRIASYDAKKGLLAVNAYTDRLESVIDDNAGLYVDVLEQATDDKLLRRSAPRERRGIISEFTTGALISSIGYLALPASMRHDEPAYTNQESSAYDMQVWKTVPDVLPANPDFKIQVKSSPNRKRPYMSDITMICVKDDLRPNYPDHMAHLLIRLYSGERLSRHESRRLRSAQATIRKKLSEA